MSEIARNGRTRSRRSRALVLRIGTVGALAVIVLAALSLGGAFGGESGPGPLTIDKALAAVTAAQGEIVHIKITGVDSDKSTFVQENWSCSDEPWRYRGMTETSTGGRQEVAMAVRRSDRQHLGDAGRDHRCTGRAEGTGRVV